jgi:hypothetical protein
MLIIGITQLEAMAKSHEVYRYIGCTSVRYELRAIHQAQDSTLYIAVIASVAQRSKINDSEIKCHSANL